MTFLDSESNFKLNGWSWMDEFGSSKLFTPVEGS
jgi:hypothetical protein